MKSSFAVGCIVGIASGVQVQYGYNNSYNNGYNSGYNNGYNNGYQNNGYSNNAYSNGGYSGGGYGGNTQEKKYTYVQHNPYDYGSQVFFNVPRTQQVHYRHNHRNDEIYGYNSVPT